LTTVQEFHPMVTDYTHATLPAPLSGVSTGESATGVPEDDRRVVILESSLRILRDQPRLGDSWQRAEWRRMLEQDRAALRGLGRLA
jgi:hypothetical protein